MKELFMVCGDSVDIETLMSAKVFLNKQGFSYISYYLKQDLINTDFNNNYFNKLNLDLDNSTLLLIGTNVRQTLPLFNLHIRKAVLKKKLKVYLVDSFEDLTYFSVNLGNSTLSIKNILLANCWSSLIFYKSKKIYICLGTNILEREDFSDIMKSFLRLKKYKYFTNKLILKVIYPEVTNCNMHMLGFGPGINDFYDKTYNIVDKKKNNKILYLLNVGDIIINNYELNKIIYQGSFGLKILNKCDYILPVPIFIEKNSTYLNFLGMKQKTKFIQVPPQHTRAE